MDLRASSVVLALVGALFLPQDPVKRPTAPRNALPLEPVQEPFVAAVDRSDLIQRFRPRSPLGGWYELRGMVIAGQPVLRAKGYMVIGNRYLSFHLQAPGVFQDVPMIRSGFRRYRIAGDSLVMSSLVGHFNDEDGDVIMVAPGIEIVREWEVVGALLRIYTGGGGFMEFARVE